MSEQPVASARRENVFTHKIGPLPMWAWVAIVAAVLVAWRLYSSKKSGTSATTQPTTTPSTPADQVPQFVNQTYVSTGAPLARHGDKNQVPVPTTAPAPTPAPTIPAWWNTTPTPGPVPAPSTAPTSPASVRVQQFPPPTGLRTTSVGNNSVGLQWTTVPSGTQYPTSYTVAIYNSKGKLASETTVSTPDATGAGGVTTVTGLAAKTAYHANVWANGGAVAPKGASVSFKTS